MGTSRTHQESVHWVGAASALHPSTGQEQNSTQTCTHLFLRKLCAHRRLFLRDSFPEGGLQLQGAETRPRLSTWMAKLLSNLHSCQRTRILAQNALLVSQQSHLTHRGGHGALKSQGRVFQASPFPAVAASPENWLEMQMWRPRPSPPESETPGVGPAVWKQALRVLVVPAESGSHWAWGSWLGCRGKAHTC